MNHINKYGGGDFMAIDFFEKELTKVQERFNQTFGKQTVCNLELRYSTILAICRLGRECEKIRKTKRKDDVRSEIKRFMKARNILNNLFDQFENQREERDHDYSSSNARIHIRR